MRQSAPRWTFLPALVFLGFSGLILTSPFAAITVGDLTSALGDAAIRSAVVRTIWTSLCSATIAMCLAIPTAYALTCHSSWRRWGDAATDAILALPPSVIGLCLILLFRTGVLRPVDDLVGIALQLPAVLLAQTIVATALATRILRTAFDRLPADALEVARVLGGRPAAIFQRIVIPATRREIAAAGLVAWARAFGEFGPVLLFAGVTRYETEVLSTSIHLELGAGRVGVAAVLALAMIFTAVCVTFAMAMLTPELRADKS